MKTVSSQKEALLAAALTFVMPAAVHIPKNGGGSGSPPGSRGLGAWLGRFPADSAQVGIGIVVTLYY